MYSCRKKFFFTIVNHLKTLGIAGVCFGNRNSFGIKIYIALVLSANPR